MTTVNAATPSRRWDSSVPLKAIAILLAVSAIGYGVARMAEQSNSLGNAAIAAVHEDRTPGSEPLPSTRNDALTTDESSRSAAPADDPRECAPEKGLTDSCIYD